MSQKYVSEAASVDEDDDAPFDRQDSAETVEKSIAEDSLPIVDEDDAKEYDWDELGMMIGYAVLSATIADCGPLIEYTGANSDIEFDEPILASAPENSQAPHETMYLRASASFRGDMMSGKNGFIGGYDGYSNKISELSFSDSNSRSVSQYVPNEHSLEPTNHSLSKSGSVLYPSAAGTRLSSIPSREPSRESLVDMIADRENHNRSSGSIAARAAALNIPGGPPPSGRIGERKNSAFSTASSINTQQPSYDAEDIERSNFMQRNMTASASYDAVYAASVEFSGKHNYRQFPPSIPVASNISAAKELTAVPEAMAEEPAEEESAEEASAAEGNESAESVKDSAAESVEESAAEGLEASAATNVAEVSEGAATEDAEEPREVPSATTESPAEVPADAVVEGLATADEVPVQEATVEDEVPTKDKEGPAEVSATAADSSEVSATAADSSEVPVSEDGEIPQEVPAATAEGLAVEVPVKVAVAADELEARTEDEVLAEDAEAPSEELAVVSAVATEVEQGIEISENGNDSIKEQAVELNLPEPPSK